MHAYVQATPHGLSNLVLEALEDFYLKKTGAGTVWVAVSRDEAQKRRHGQVPRAAGWAGVGGGGVPLRAGGLLGEALLRVARREPPRAREV